jgi:2-keto-4-pentenoate hydratase
VIDIHNLALELTTAFAEGRTLSTPPSRDGLDLSTAYAVERELVRLRRSAGHETVGVKVGYANKAIWRALKLDTLVWAHMYDHTVRYADACPPEPWRRRTNVATLSLAHTISPKIEPEIVFKMKAPLSAGITEAAAALEAVEWLALGFEIIDCPYADWKYEPADFVAAYGLHAALVVGEPCPVTATNISELVEQLPKFKVRLSRSDMSLRERAAASEPRERSAPAQRRARERVGESEGRSPSDGIDGQLVEEGSGRNSLRSPALCLAELASAMAKQDGADPLAAGDLVSSGTLTESTPIQPGETWTLSVEDIALPTLTLTLV